MNRLFRQDAADYIKRRRPGYEITLYNNNYETRKLSENVLLCKRGSGDEHENEEETNYFMKFTNGQHIIVGNSYIMKVDTVLNCPIYDVNNKCVISIDEDINECYDDSDDNLTDDEMSPPVDIATVESVETEGETETDTDTDTDSEEDTPMCNDDVDKMNIASEFEIIEEQE